MSRMGMWLFVAALLPYSILAVSVHSPDSFFLNDGPLDEDIILTDNLLANYNAEPLLDNEDAKLSVVSILLICCYLLRFKYLPHLFINSLKSLRNTVIPLNFTMLPLLMATFYNCTVFHMEENAVQVKERKSSLSNTVFFAILPTGWSTGLTKL